MSEALATTFVLIGVCLLALLVCWLVDWAYNRPEPEEPGEVIEVPFGPNDILVVECPNRISRDQVQRIKAQLLRGLAGDQTQPKLLILEGGMKVKVLHRD